MTLNRSLDFLALTALYVLVLRKRWKARGRDVLLVNTVMYVYLSFVLFFTLMPVIAALPSVLSHPYAVHLEPFADYRYGWGDAERQIVLNVLMTVPFGFLFPLTQRQTRRGFLRTLLCAAALSLGIELLQPLLHSARSCDITDVITNSFGGAVGFLLYRLFRPVTASVLRRIREKTQKRRAA